MIEDRQALAFSLFVVSSCIVFVASGYAVLYVETRRHRKLIKIQQMPQEEAERFRKENKALKTTVYVVSALMLCFLPMALRLVIHLMKRPEIISSQWVRTFAMLNSLLNPLIYCCRQEEMRDFVFKTRTQASLHGPFWCYGDWMATAKHKSGALVKFSTRYKAFFSESHEDDFCYVYKRATRGGYIRRIAWPWKEHCVWNRSSFPAEYWRMFLSE